MDNAKLKDLRNILYKMALIGFLFLMTMSLFSYFCFDFTARMLMVYMKLQPSFAPFALTLIIGMFEMMLITFFLVPALAIHLRLHTKQKPSKGK